MKRKSCRNAADRIAAQWVTYRSSWAVRGPGADPVLMENGWHPPAEPRPERPLNFRTRR